MRVEGLPLDFVRPVFLLEEPRSIFVRLPLRVEGLPLDFVRPVFHLEEPRSIFVRLPLPVEGLPLDFVRPVFHLRNRACSSCDHPQGSKDRPCASHPANLSQLSSPRR